MSEHGVGKFSIRKCPVDRFEDIETAPHDEGTLWMVCWLGETHEGEIAFVQGERSREFAEIFARAPEMAGEIERLRAINAELLAALKFLADGIEAEVSIFGDSFNEPQPGSRLAIAKSAITKAEAQPCPAP